MDLRLAHERQITRLSGRIATLNQINARFVRWRLGVFLAGLLISFFLFNLSNTLGWCDLIVTTVSFGILVFYHRRIQRGVERAAIWQRIKYESLARMTLHWSALPEATHTHFTDHPFATDIDMVGEISLYRLMDATISTGGSTRLRNWLLTTHPDAEDILKRQALVRELIPLTTFRDRLTLAVRLTGKHQRWDGDRILGWLRQDDSETIALPRVLILAGLAAVNITLMVLDGLNLLPSLWVGSMLVYWIIMGSTLNGLGDFFSKSLSLQSEVERLAATVASLENYRYQPNSSLKSLCKPFIENRPSQLLKRIRRIIAGMSLSRNVILWFWLNTFVPWDIFFAFLLQNSKARLLAVLPTWLETLYEVDALNALAHFAYLNPDYTFPIITSESKLVAVQIGHPLIPDQQRVCNDFQLNNGQVVILTGSNMSGKSSFLRTLGVNLCLTYAGGVVCAHKLEVGLFRLFTCIRVSDSVTDGISYFYAEVKRLKALLNALQTQDNLPLFFLIDEIFRGTNNRERLIGSQAYIQALAKHHGCGLISTHDLELVTLADENHILNYHFREDVTDGQMIFDYKLRHGASPTTNALKIMALEGLPLP